MSRRTASCVAVVVAVLLLFPRPVLAQQGLVENLRGILDTTFSSITTTTTDASGSTTRSSNSVLPTLTLDTETLIYPSLRLGAGGVFEFDTLFSPDSPTASTVSVTRLRPYFELRVTNPIFFPRFSYFRKENRTRTSGFPSVNLISEDYAGYLGWRPVGLPSSDFQLIRTNTFDGDRTFQDTTKDFGQVLSRYAYRDLNLYYQGSFLDTTDRVHGVKTRQVSNSGRVDHARTFFAKRLQWSGMYNVNRQDLTTTATGDGGEASLPIIPFTGLSLLSDTPVTAILSPNPLIVDANLTASAGINLGLPPVGTNTEARNIGLDFLTPTRVNRFWIWIDRNLPVEIARTFSWEIYSSPDNLIWSRETVVPVALFGPFENRFEVDVPAITARYLKVVTRPLSPAVPEASRYPDIFVTEMQAFLTAPAADASGTLVRTTQNLNADVRLRILSTPSLYYEGSYWYNGVDFSDSSSEGSPEADLYRDTLSNGVSVNHRFSRMVSAYARGALERGMQPEGHRAATVTSATLTMDPISTFNASLLYAGQDEEIDDRPNDRRSLAVQTNTQLYRGVDLQFGFGWNFTTRETGEELHDRYLNLTASIVPRENVTLTFNYVGTTTTRSGTFVGDPQYYTKRGLVTLAFDPIRTLHVVLQEDVLAVSNQNTRITTNIGINWAPFPDGSLQFIVAYDDALRPPEFGTERTFQSGVRWMISRRSYINVSYQRLKSEFVELKTESKIFSVDLRLFF